MQWAMEDVTDSMVAAVNASTPCDFCYNFVVLGRGHIVSSMTTMASDDGEHTSVQWHGRMHLAGDNGDVHIRLPLSQVSDVRSKCIDDEPAMVMMTVDNEHFLQLVVGMLELCVIMQPHSNAIIRSP